MGAEDVMNAVCWVVIEGRTMTIANLNDLLYYMVVVSAEIR